MNTNQTLTKKQKQQLDFLSFVQYCANQCELRLKLDSKTLSALRVLAAGIDTSQFSYSRNPRLLAMDRQIARLFRLTYAGQQTLLSDFVKRIPADELHFQDSRRMAKIVLNIE